MRSQGKPIGPGLILGLLLLGFINQNQNRDLVRPFRKNWLNISCPGSLNPFQGQYLNLDQEINLHQRTIHHHQKTELKLCYHKLSQDPSYNRVCYQTTCHIYYQTTLPDKQRRLNNTSFM